MVITDAIYYPGVAETVYLTLERNPKADIYVVMNVYSEVEGTVHMYDNEASYTILKDKDDRYSVCMRPKENGTNY
jgi:hypothetical protein